jgi:prepilin-type N-terminal cleavage/methylation domain-containing protein
MMIHSSRKPVGGFTLIELMTVITIMVILAAATVAGVSFVTEYQAKKKAQIDIELLSKAIEEYKLDTGQYPGVDVDTAVEGDVSEQLYQALFLDGYAAQTNSAASEVKMYVPELDPRNRKQSWVTVTYDGAPSLVALKIFDPWKRSYRYRKGANAQNPDFDLWSTGKDGETKAENPDRTIKENRDDIRNF